MTSPLLIPGSGPGFFMRNQIWHHLVSTQDCFANLIDDSLAEVYLRSQMRDRIVQRSIRDALPGE